MASFQGLLYGLLLGLSLGSKIGIRAGHLNSSIIVQRNPIARNSMGKYSAGLC